MNKGQLTIDDVLDPKKDVIKVGRIDKQIANILKHLQDGNSITPIEALNCFGSFRLSAVIFTLKIRGHNIVTEMMNEDGKRYAKYFMVVNNGRA